MATRSFQSCLQSTNEAIKKKPITTNNGLKDAYFSLKINKSA